MQRPTVDAEMGKGHPHTLSGRVDASELARVDAAARLTDQPRAHFVVRASLRVAEEVLRSAVTDDREEAEEEDDDEPEPIPERLRVARGQIGTIHFAERWKRRDVGRPVRDLMDDDD